MAVRLCLLNDGRVVRLRAVDREDLGALAALHRGVTPATWRARFHGAAVPSAHYLRALTRLAESGDGVAVVATCPGDDRIVAVAECRIDPALPGPTAHVGILVHDDFQGVSLGAQLWDDLVAAARRAGIARLQVHARSDDRRLLALVGRRGTAVSRLTSSGETQVVIDLHRDRGSARHDDGTATRSVPEACG